MEPTSTELKTKGKVVQGLVASNKADKTITVLIERRLPHPTYGKYFKRSKKFMAHDPNNDANIGDVVKIVECRPVSKRKTWKLIEIVERKK